MVYLLFFLSGFAGLVYEISWSRQIGLLFGHTAHASAIVLGAYFGGMALGNWIAGRASLRHPSPLRGYGVAELVVATWALLTPLAIALLRIPAVAQLLNHPDPAVQTAVRAVAAMLVLLCATVPLGATLPFIAQHVSPRSAPRPRLVAFAYAINTAGALAGSLAATFVLILMLGVTASSYLAAGISAVCGLGALWLARSSRQTAVVDTVALEDRGKLSAIPWLTYLLVAVSGFGTVGLQVLYARLFSLLLHNSTYSFGTIVFVFLAALALSGWLVARSRIEPGRITGWAFVLGGLCIPLAVLLLRAITDFDYLRESGGFNGYMFAALSLVSITVFVPILLLGMVLPDLWAATAGSAGSVVGRLTAINTIAATCGVFTVAFVLLPQIGLWNSIGGFSIMFGLAGVLALWAGRRASLRWALLVLPATLVASIAVSGVTRSYEARAAKLGYKYVFRQETSYGQVDVLRRKQGGDLVLRQNRHYSLGSTVALDSEVLQGTLPLRLHRDPQNVAFLGLATGITAGAALHDQRLRSLTSVELIPAVVEAAELFADFNTGILTDDRTTVVVNDARHYLYATAKRFDVVVSDLFVPWHSQTGYLYTVEHYRSAFKRLAHGGIFFQWLPAYQLSAEQFELIADSFAHVFPCTSVWVYDSDPRHPLVGLAGSQEPMSIGVDGFHFDSTVTDHVNPAQRELAAALDESLLFDLSESYLGDWHTAPGAELNTDERPLVEFLAPKAELAQSELTGKKWSQYKVRTLNLLPKEHVAFDRSL
ncbi:MAG: fused MFS/spermidine synthase [bacterium]|nr:fused MFS/spermidine synthase [bacterium]